MTEGPVGKSTSDAHRTLGTLLRRSWALILIGTLVGLAVGAFVLSTLTKEYTASASVSVTPTGVSDATVANSRTGTTVNLDTEAQVVRSNSVITNVRAIDKSAKSLSAQDLSKPVTITVPPNSSILTINYTATSAKLAATRANAFATAYLRSRAAAADAILKAKTAKAQSTVTSLTKEYKSLSATIDKLPKDSSQLTVLRTQRSLALSQIKQLTRNITGYSTTAVTPGQVLTSATTPTSPSSPSRILWLAGGLAVGLLLGLIAAWLHAIVHVRFRHRDDVARALRLPIIGAVPSSSAKSVLEAGSSVSDPYRRIANVVLATRPDPGVLLLTGPCTSTALAAVTANLAAALASSDRAVVISSTDDDGVLAGRLTDDVASFGVRVNPLPSGMPAQTPLDAVRRDGWLVVAGVNPESSALVQAVAAASDVVVVLVEAKSKTRRSANVVEQLDTVGAPLLGVILLPSARWWRRFSTRHLRAGQGATPRSARRAVDDARTANQPSGARPATGAAAGGTALLDDTTGASARQDIARRS